MSTPETIVKPDPKEEMMEFLMDWVMDEIFKPVKP